MGFEEQTEEFETDSVLWVRATVEGFKRGN